ncbi:patatin-like phospholipase family protein [Gordonia polyisoprenivorans VH2]|uniref:Patatin-like phospholipase family protein n=1 Tax=Gordonia polyisoprenivorans (strain DSM 44266 / VH2) TaxID=1112204 RepID=H6N4B2_GORPV|nr:patatin-like phospholipase family protein [Gordonia polyisoprenivorans]AFA72381.1 patatin-like phospholipase family protein [Gordonia polyisoprenivorans VH2]OZC29317.1 esterase [Gordonia polyisoprenivorans]UZF57771.1 patatin-like phospholipase family protein [Gordonia polyisoprenivorans]
MAGGSRVALALGSGGARGYAHIGVIAELEARGFSLVSIAGSSMGALVGGLHCAGGLAEYVEWISGLNQLDVMRLLDVSLTKPGGVIGAERIVARVQDILGDVAIEDLPIPFTAVATDLGAGRSVWFQRGRLVDAIRASIAIPGVIAPHLLDGRLLADGGILDPLPVAPTSAVASDVTIGVVLDGEGGSAARAARETKAKGVIRRNVDPILSSEFVRSVRDRIGLDPHADAPDSADTVPSGTEDIGPAGEDPGGEPKTGEPKTGEPKTGEPKTGEPKTMGRIEVLSRSLDIMSIALTRHQIAGYPPDILIEIPRKSVRTLDFHKASEMIELGRSKTADALDRLPELP